MQDRFGLRPATVANHQMSRGLVQFVGMDVLHRVDDLARQVEPMAENS